MKQSSRKDGDDSDQSLLGSESDGDDDGDGGGGSHLTLLDGFFPTLAESLRRHLQVRLPLIVW